jgi:ABC-type uncharacterized transport system auxiliary subunit
MAIVMVIFSLGLPACTGVRQPAPVIGYYTLEYLPPKSLPKGSGYALKIERFRNAPPYGTNRMHYREGPFQLQPYVYHKWLSPPGDMVAFLLLRDFQASSCFDAAIAPEDGYTPTHRMLGSVDEFFEQDDEERWLAVLSVTITLLDETTAQLGGRLVFQRRYQSTKASKRKHPQALADAMSQALADVSEQIIADVCAKIGESDIDPVP